QSEKLEESLSHFGVQATVIEAVQGPTVTSFELTVGQGTKVSRVRNLTDDLKLALAARDIRIQAPIPGKSSIGIEIPNKTARPVRISEVIQSTSFQQSTSPMEAVLGLGLTGEPVTLDLRKMPHGLIAGATGSGKSVCINSILVSLLYKASPVDVKMMLIDPKMVELAPYNGIPHLISPVITDVKAATAALKWAVQEMERRYELLAHAGVRNIEAFNKQADEHRQFAQKMPYLLIVIDELADLMMMAPADVEISISRIAQKARACGIHLIIATQRPSVDVITGIIKANIPTRIAFSVSSQVDSRTMIDTNGAERLLGKGDMLYIGNGESTAVRLQGTFVTDDEIDRIIEHVQNEASPNYLFGQDELLKSAVEEDEDPLFLAACEFIYAQDSASTSMLQRNFSIGYNRAAKLMDRLEDLGFISPQQGSKARDVYLTAQDLSELKETVL
ncbi:MAG TPA: DNA translocase FtsK, partial [Sporosarcina sp.]|nr:DNA translocase FtsK [Sporosarcina sp.]